MQPALPYTRHTWRRSERSSLALIGGQKLTETSGPPPATDTVFLARTSNIIEALCNLNYLICAEADNPGMVRRYSSQAEERLRAMIHLLDTRRTNQ
jgi:hypothetical protein